MGINIHTIGTASIALICIGGLVSIIAVGLFLAVGSGVSLGKPDDTLHAHDTYFIVIHGPGRLVFLLPLVAGLILMLSGLLIRREVAPLGALADNPVAFESPEPEGDAGAQP